MPEPRHTQLDLPLLVERASAQHGSLIAVEDVEGRRLTFTEVGARSNRLANALGGFGEKGDRVGILLSNRVEYVEVDLAIIKGGFTKVPINPRLADDECEFIAEHAEISVLFAEATSFERAVTIAEKTDSVREVILLDYPQAGSRSYDEILATASDASPRVARDPASFISQILYTSGTTGRPKGAVLSESVRIDATLRMLSDELCHIGRGDTMAHAAPMSHGSGSKTLAYFLRGARNFPLASFDAEQFLELSASHTLTASFMVPTMINMITQVAKQRRDGRDLPLTTITYGGAPMPLAQLDDALATFGPAFVQVYGCSEAPHPLTVLDRDALASPSDRIRSSIGREATFGILNVLAPDGTAVAPGDMGELAVPAAHAMTGYWHDADATARVLRDSHYWTGDLATRDDDGYIHIVGRSKEMIITGGFNVYPAEVERVLAAHEGVREVAVVGAPDDKWGEIVTAWIVRSDEASGIGEAELSARCKENLASYKQPRRFYFLESMPKGSTGKILKSELARAAQSDHGG